MPVWGVVDSEGVPQPGSVQPTELRSIVSFVEAARAKDPGSPDWAGWRERGYACRRFALERAPEEDGEREARGPSAFSDGPPKKRPENEKGA